MPTQSDHSSNQSIFRSPIPARRGSLSKRFMKCSKPHCACAHTADKRHGPYFSLTRVVAGKTVSRYLSAEQADVAQKQIAAGSQLRNDIEEFWLQCEAKADAELDQPSNTVTKKKGSRRKLPLNLPLKSNP